MTTFVLYRANEALSARIAETKPGYRAKEFPAVMSIDAVATQLLTIEAEINSKRILGDELFVDGTVLSAIAQTDTFKHFRAEYRLFLIQQDNATAYDWYAGEVARIANSRRVLIVRDKIGHHNTDGCTSSEAWHNASLMGNRGYEVRREAYLIAKWQERLAAYGIAPDVVGSFYYDRNNTLNPDLGSLENTVVVCDHHNGQYLQRDIQKAGGIYMDAYPPAEDEDLFSKGKYPHFRQ